MKKRTADRNPLRNETLASIMKRVKNIHHDYLDNVILSKQDSSSTLVPIKVLKFVLSQSKNKGIHFAPLRVLGYGVSTSDYREKQKGGMKVHGTKALNSISKHGFIIIPIDALPFLKKKLVEWFEEGGLEVNKDADFVIHPSTLVELLPNIKKFEQSYRSLSKFEKEIITDLLTSGNLEKLSEK